MDKIRSCKECRKIWEGYPEVLCCCGDSIDDDLHCHIEGEESYLYGENGKRKVILCVPFIKDCEEHAHKCNIKMYGDCHEECACRNP